MNCPNKKSISYDEKAIGARIQKLREEKGVTQKAVGEILDLKPAGYSKLELGNSSLAAKHCISLADYFGVSCDYILRGIDAEKIDFVRETGLSQKAVETLAQVEASRRSSHAIALKYKKLISDKNNDFDEKPFSPHIKLSLDELCELDSDNDKAFEKAFENFQKLSIRSYILNALIVDDEFWKDISEACREISSATIWHLFDMSPGIDISESFLKHTEKKYVTEVNAGRYIAGLAFGKFIEKISTDVKFIGCVGNTLEQYSNLFEIAIKKGILHDD